MMPWTRPPYQGWIHLQKITLEYMKSIAKQLRDKAHNVKFT